MRQLRRPDRPRKERGSITPLIIGFGISLILLTAVVFDASQVWIYQRGLHALADGASLEAANALDADSVYSGDGIGDSIRLDEQAAHDRVQAYIAQVQPERANCLNVDVTDDGEQVTVSCDGTAKLPIISSALGAVGDVGVQSQATAETFTSN